MPQSGRIERIEVFNFKSYKGEQTIGPFHKFSAVIGPNGAGKSNLMDAVSFVLGVKTKQLRGTRLRDLVYRVEGDQMEGTEEERAWVQLVFLHGPEGEERELLFRREITPAGSSEYSINGKVVSWDAYDARLQKFGILVKARNFLVFQGDVESIASKSPKELTALIESISGSDQLSEEYDRLADDKNKAEENTIFNFQKRKGISAEKKQYKEQKEEAERFNELVKTQRDVLLEYMLFQFFHIEKNLSKDRKLVENGNKQLEDLDKSRDDVEKRFKKMKARQAKSHQKTLDLEKQLRQKERELRKKSPDLIKNQEEIAHITQRLESSVKSAKKQQADFDEQRNEINALETELDEVRKKASDFEAQVQEREAQEKLVLSEEQQEEYNNRKQEAGRETAPIKQELEGLIRQQRLDSEMRDTSEAKLRDLQARKKHLAETEEQYERRYSKVQEFIDQTEAKKRELEEELASVSAANKAASEQQEKLMAQLEDIHEQLNEAKVDIRSDQREIRFREALESMKRIFPGVIGRMVDLVEPQARQYHVAVSVVLGRNMEAIVVDDAKTAEECINYLKEQRVGTATFLPLSSLKVKPIHERLRNQLATSKSAKLIIDLLKFDSRIQKAVLYAVGNTVYCDTLDEAKTLAFDRAQPLRTVSKNGTLIRKSGLMTGGPGIGAKAKKWDEKKVEGLKKKRDKYITELQEVGRTLRGVTREQQLTSQTQGLQGRLDNFKIDLGLTKDKLTRTREERESVEAEIETLEEQLARLTKAIEAREATIAAQTARIHEIEDEQFRAFSEQVGVTNIRDYEEKREAWEKEKAEKRLMLGNQVSLLENQLKYEQNRDVETSLNNLKQRIKDDKAALKELEKSIKVLQKEENKEKKETDELKRQRDEAKKEVESLEGELQDIKKKLNGLIEQAGKQHKHLTALETEMDQLRMRRHNLYQRCKVDNIALPQLTEEGAEEIPSLGVEFPSEEMELATQDVREMTEKEDDINLDFSKLSKKLQTIPKDEEGRVKQELEQKLQGINLAMQKMAPNLRATDHFNEVETRLRTTEDEFEDARTRAKEAAERFAAKKQERYDTFMKAYNHIAENIDTIYKALTRSTSHVGGTAFLNLENPDEPYLHGIKYNAMPPLKRFRDIEQLSGGERTVAALALLFAIHSYQPSPFFVLDEVDAALDNHNIAKVVRYIRSRVEDDDLQCIVISLKDTFYSRADALVGIYRDQDLDCSGTVTLSLEDYPDGKTDETY